MYVRLHYFLNIPTKVDEYRMGDSLTFHGCHDNMIITNTETPCEHRKFRNGRGCTLGLQNKNTFPRTESTRDGDDSEPKNQSYNHRCSTF